MYCSKCGEIILEDAKFCNKCGEPVPAVWDRDLSVIKDKKRFKALRKSYLSQKQYGMKWYLFLVYFAIPLAIIGNLFNPFGSMYETLSYGYSGLFTDANVIQTIESTSNIIWLLSIALAILLIFVWRSLFYFRKYAFRMYTIYLLANMFLICFCFYQSAVLSNDDLFRLVIRVYQGIYIAECLVMVLLNRRYFRRRSTFFIY
ncbi:hypothetical protein SDC9_152034 [bioreactor metagenome]|uniref:Zinc-ribbon domain-containing protein n=1 Tax=bioreactor metagenome TaxID=1076179 RepID=A0A645ETN3_9ZZZZ